MNELGALQEILKSSSAMIARAGVAIPGFDAPVPFQYELNALRAKQRHLESLLQPGQQARTTDPNLGAVTLLIAAGAGAVLGISAIGGWIYSHFTDAKTLDAKTDMYQQIRDEGISAEDAAKLVFPPGTDWSSIMDKLIIISVIGAGVAMVFKFK